HAPDRRDVAELGRRLSGAPPHRVAYQQTSGTPVSRAQLKPNFSRGGGGSQGLLRNCASAVGATGIQAGLLRTKNVKMSATTIRPPIPPPSTLKIVVVSGVAWTGGGRPG